ncbi:DNA-entry nuclease [Peribacillus frigoritolerans]|uniref:DNA-entry nuclease n=1 Tax=Peribacillus frigoritolerans TaxID=450367 RepID=UPI003D064512
MRIEDIKFEYDTQGRIKYMPEVHENQWTTWTEEDKEYLCKFHEYDRLESIAFALGRTKTTVADQLSTLKKKGKYEYYKNLNKFW